ncbi:hypothetical protein SDC9_82129 [bioreactor metagenome]|uniref:Uncharacterized protein n=1 Tax=bioreactor metagenome TaxID=1076179 RepID=A0A644Z3V5_9ZZZZ|nr:hypothetical protein [Eubacteriales bacterium]
MNQTLLKIIASREDISDYLFHFTKGSNAFDSLLKITEDRQLKDIRNNGVICFTEAPVTLLKSMFDIFEKYPEPMYAPYGVAIKKEHLFQLGGRPVIYGTKEEKDFLPELMKWRFEEYIPNIKDYTWLREWRLKSNLLDLTQENCFIITKTKEEYESVAFSDDCIGDIDFDGCVADGQFWGEAIGYFDRGFKGISIEDIVEFNKLSKNEIDKMIDKQDFSDTVGRNLGGFIW